MIVVHAQAGNGGRDFLFEVIVEVEGLTEDVVEVIIVDVDVVAEFVPVDARGLGGHESAKNDDDDQKNSTGTDAARGHAVALGLLILDEFDDAPEDQEQRPVVSE